MRRPSSHATWPTAPSRRRALWRLAALAVLGVLAVPRRAPVASARRSVLRGGWVLGPDD